MRAVRARQGDTVDLIAHRELGAASLAVTVLDANRGLAARGPVIDAGVRVILPDAPAPARVPTVTLW